mmetsp:Transcript_92604/g.257945  ORF Transcript_92604/g.257945 Transcript_92604/m.257945 type:complete len:320 (+) Transcript_92604:223-1182(+)
MAAVVGPGAAGAVPAEAGCGPVGGAGAASASVSVAGDAGCNAGAPGAGTTGAGALEEAAAAGTAPAPGTSGPMRLKPGLGRVLACTPASVLTAMLPPMGAAMPIVGICMAIMLPMFIGTTPMGMAMPIGMPAPTPIGIMAIGMPVPIPIAMGIPMAIGMPGDMLPAMAMGIMPPMPMPMGIMPVTVPSLEEEPAEADDALAPPPPLAPAAAAAAAAPKQAARQAPLQPPPPPPSALASSGLRGRSFLSMTSQSSMKASIKRFFSSRATISPLSFSWMQSLSSTYDSLFSQPTRLSTRVPSYSTFSSTWPGLFSRYEIIT